MCTLFIVKGHRGNIPRGIPQTCDRPAGNITNYSLPVSEYNTVNTIYRGVMMTLHIHVCIIIVIVTAYQHVM